MKTNNKLSAYILRGSTTVLLFSCVIVGLSSAINQPPKARLPQDNAAFAANAHQNRSLSFADRVAYQRAIEDVYWRHRIWPRNRGERPDPKPSLDVVMSQATIEKKVQDYLRNSELLEQDWQKPITAEQLQIEMERMASRTKQPEVLRELFAALGNDPFVIAECLARPLLAERFANGDPVATAPDAFEAAHPTRMPPQKPALAGWLAKAETQVPVTMAAVSSANYTLPVIASLSGGCTDDTWTPTSTTNAPEARSHHTAVWTGSEMIVWGGFRFDNRFHYLNTGGRYNPSTDSWTATTTTNAPSARASHTAVWTGSEMIVWGGEDGLNFLNTGGRYDPDTDSWIATSTTNAPSGRSFHRAVWTGNEMIVWGGCSNFSCDNLNTGGRYNPSTDSWTATSTTNVPTGRESHTAVWTGSEMIVWGGCSGTSCSNSLKTGGRYNPTSDTWAATSTINSPEARGLHTAVWTGSEMIVWGGFDGFEFFLNTGGRYNPGTNSWTATSTTNAPEARDAHTAVWTDSEMIVWGGTASGGSQFNTGGRYNPSTDSWTATSITNGPEGRFGHTAVWTGGEMIVWGGTTPLGYVRTGGRYCAAAPSPTPTPTPTGTPAACTNYNTSTGTGTITPGDTDTGNHCDDCSTFISLPFPVSVYGQTFTAANVASNGSLDLIGAQSVFSSACPFPTSFYDMAIFAYQFDLVTDQTPPDCVNFASGCGIFTSTTGTAPNRQFNIEWRTGYPFSSGTANFEVVFYEGQSSFFDVIYGATADNGLCEGSGVQASATGPATTFSCLTATLTNGLKVTYNCSGPTPTPTPTATATPTATPTPGALQLRGQKKKVNGMNTVRLNWQGATSLSIDVYRDNVLIATTPNAPPFLYTDFTGDTGRAQYTYRVCEAGTATCSNDLRVRFQE